MAAVKRPRDHDIESPDFATLAQNQPSLAKYLKRPSESTVTIDFKDPSASRALTCALLKEFFDLDLDIPLDKLIPAVPSRLQYVRWIEELLSLDPDATPVDAQAGTVRGVDIGTGASGIYALLGTKVYGWSFLATDIEPDALRYAEANVARNGLQERISARLVSDPDQVLVGVIDEGQRYDFVMCNPPFFGDSEELGRTHERQSGPKGVNTGAPNEVMVDGGEVAFVLKIVRDSLVLRDRVRWYTSLLGKKASLKPVLAELKKHKVTNVRHTEFLQARTHRWAVAWSFTDEGEESLPPLSQRYKTTAPPPREESPDSKLPDHMLRVIEVSDVELLLRSVCDALSYFEIEHEIASHITHEVDVRPRRITWSRKARRERERRLAAQSAGEPMPEQQKQPQPVTTADPVFEAKIEVVRDLEEPTVCHVMITHLTGPIDDFHAFELHFARRLAQTHEIPDLPTDLQHARNL